MGDSGGNLELGAVGGGGRSGRRVGLAGVAVMAWGTADGKPSATVARGAVEDAKEGFST